MRNTSNLSIPVPQQSDDVLVDVLSHAFDLVDSYLALTEGSCITITRDATTNTQTVALAPKAALVSTSLTDAPSSQAVADFVQDKITASGTYQGQFGYYGTLAQIKTMTPASDATAAQKTGVYINNGKVFTIVYGTSWPSAGTEYGSQVAGDSYDIINLIDYPATGGGYEAGQLRLIVTGTVGSFVVTGASKAVKSIGVTGNFLTLDETDPFVPKLSVSFGTVAAATTTKAVTGADVFTAVESKQNKLSGNAGSVVEFGGSAGTVTSRAISTVPTQNSSALITSGAVYDSLLTLEDEEYVVSFASTQPAGVAGEKILWIHA
jgi:hypothetical protein